MKECPFCKAQVPDLAHYCTNCGKTFGAEEAADTVAKAETTSGTSIETRYVPGHSDIAIVKIAGYCDDSQTKKLNMELANVRNDNPKIVIFDFSGTEGICSMALSSIIAFVSDREDEREKSTALINVRESVMQVMDCLGIGAMLPIYATINEALKALSTR